jgi:transcriptional regulator with XRE-family HTH domain
MSFQDFTPVGRPMSAKALLKWREEMLLSQRDAADALGWARNSLGMSERGEGAPKYISLACSALFLNIPPFGSRAWNKWCKDNKHIVDELIKTRVVEEE